MNGKISPEQLADNARKARKRVFSSQEAAAKFIDCARTTVTGWENTKNPTPIKGSEYQMDAARAYKVRLKWLVDGEGPDGYPWIEPEASTVAPATAPKPDNDNLPDSPNDELWSALYAIARVLALTKLDVAEALAGELQTLQPNRHLVVLQGVVERAHATLQGSSPQTRASKVRKAKKHSRA